MANIHLIVCDDIREETGGKKSYIGAYSREIVCQNIPINLPKLCFRLSIEENLNKRAESIGIEIALPGESTQTISVPIEELKRQIDEEQKKQAEAGMALASGYGTFLVELIASPITLNQQGTIRVNAIINGRRRRAGSIIVRLADTESTEVNEDKKTSRKSSRVKSRGAN